MPNDDNTLASWLKPRRSLVVYRPRPHVLGSHRPSKSINSIVAERLKKSMRILVYCGGSYVSGAEIIELSVMRGLQERGHTVYCITNAWNDGELHRRLDEAGIPYRAISLGAISASLQPKYMWWTLNAVMHLPKAYIDFWNVQRRFDPDVLLFSGARSLSTILPLVDLNQTVLHVHEVPGGSRHFRRIVEANDAGGCKAYIAVSNFIGDCLRNSGIPADRVHMVHNGIQEPNTRQVTRVKDRDGSADIQITIAGQIGAWKGHEDVIDALRLLPQSVASWQCNVVGSGADEYLRKLKQRVRHARVNDQVKWLGFQRDMAQVYDRTDIMVVPSRHEEPFGLVAAEAGLYGIPVIATRRGGLTEIVKHGETGFLVKAKAPGDIAARLAELIASPELRARMGAAAHAHVRSTFTQKRMIDGVEEVLRSAARCN